MVIVVGDIFVSTHGTTVLRTMAAATDKAVTPISMARKRWDTMTPLVWSNNNNKKINNSGGNVTASTPRDSYACAANTAAFA
jgi:hypothetical protein